MSYNGSGAFQINTAGQPVVAATTIDATVFNTLTADVATGLSTAICKDGQTTVTADIPLAAHKLTGMSAGTARTDSASLATIQDGTGVYVATVAGTADVITLTPTPAITAYAAGQTFRFIASGANTTNVTVAVNGLAAKAITKNGTTALVAGDIPAASMVQITYDGTRFILTATNTAILNSPTINSPTLSGTPIFPDNVFTVGGSADATKKLAFEVDGLTTATTRTVTVQDQNGTMALLTDAFTTGDVKLTIKTVADTSWVLMNDTTIGNASSNATGRANADTSALFTLIYANFIDQWCKIYTSGGVLTTRGANAAADYAANKALELPKTLGRALAGYGVGTTKEVATTSSANGLVVESNNTKWVTGMTVVVSALSGFGGTITATTYFLVRVSATNIRFATTLALAQAGTPDITITGTGSATVTYTFTSRALGEQAGEEAHAMSITELIAHTHTEVGNSGSNAPLGGTLGGTVNTGSTGGNAAMNIMQPTIYLNVMCKL